MYAIYYTHIHIYTEREREGGGGEGRGESERCIKLVRLRLEETLPCILHKRHFVSGGATTPLQNKRNQIRFWRLLPAGVMIQEAHRAPPTSKHLTFKTSQSQQQQNVHAALSSLLPS